MEDTYLHHSHANRFEFRFQGESSCHILMPGTFQKSDIVTNSATSSHLNDNFVLVCVFPPHTERQQWTKVLDLNDKGDLR